eukprot:TRINITY_DN12314_c1_g1_i1.p1 TRINITY_DN12314_c1_g1~~TRINITY_DN12314_c1_g1_i1.p1  ORF type:complete len:415 (+),score=81.12 TRINITY_DN12314_c1_g1_i1:75-1319(+)
MFALRPILAAVLLNTLAFSFEIRGSRGQRLVPSVPAENQAAFAAFIKRQGRTYKPGSKEYQRRFDLFSAHLEKVAAFNAMPRKLWTAGVTKHADFSEEELSRLRGWSGSASPRRGGGSKSLRSGIALAQESLPDEVTWSNLSVLGNVRDQGDCGSCWAVAASTVLDSHAEIYKSSQTSFAAQNILDCTPNPRECGGSGGCQGATVELAMSQVMKHGALTEDEDSYSGSDKKCKNSLLQTSGEGSGDHLLDSNDFSSAGQRYATEADAGPKFGMIGWERLPENKYAPLLRAVAEHGPVGVSVDATIWNLYLTGVVNGCGKNAVINHAVTLVGYGKDDYVGVKYWLIQNSWGSDWGENGRIRLLREEKDEEDYCGTDNQPSEGTGCVGGPAAVKVCGMCGILYDSVVPQFADIVDA